MRKIVLTTICIVTLFSCCAKNKSKVDIPENITVTKLADILKEPASYHGKKVLLMGFVGSVCASGCDMVYQEGKDAIKIYPKGFKFSQLKQGQPIKVYAEITAEKERVIISALKLMVIK